MRRLTLLTAMLALGIATIPGHAQSRITALTPAAPVPPMPPGVFVADSGEEDRAVLGISTSSGGRRDTLGLLITSIADSGPAAKAGLEEGNRIASINGVNLRTAPSDTGDFQMSGLMARRLERELRKVKPGDDVTLDVWQDGHYRTIKVKTAAAEDVYRNMLGENGSRIIRRVSDDDRAALGLRLGGGASIRDTLGVFVFAVNDSGPAARAGIIEGNRVAAINGVNLKVSREDAGDPYVAGLESSRLSREMSRVRPGDDVTLTVWDGSRYRTVKVKAAKASSLGENRNTFFFGDGSFVVPRIRVETPRVVIPRIDGQRMRMDIRQNMEQAMRQLRGQLQQLEMQYDDQSRAATEQGREAERQAERAARDAARAAARAQDGVRVTSWSSDDAAPAPMPATWGGRSAATLVGRDGTLRVNGLSLTGVSDDLASYLGAGSEDGLLVVDARSPWDALHEGDVILAVNGTPLRHGDRYTLSLDSSHDTDFDVLRKGKRLSVAVKATR